MVKTIFSEIENYFETGNNDLGTKMIPAFIHWLRDAELLIEQIKAQVKRNPLKEVYQHKPNFTWEIIWINLAYNSTIVNWYIAMFYIISHTQKMIASNASKLLSQL
jgi:phosphoadenosine phosphosulfate reductase